MPLNLPWKCHLKPSFNLNILNLFNRKNIPNTFWEVHVEKQNLTFIAHRHRKSRLPWICIGALTLSAGCERFPWCFEAWGSCSSRWRRSAQPEVCTERCRPSSGPWRGCGSPRCWSRPSLPQTCWCCRGSWRPPHSVRWSCPLLSAPSQGCNPRSLRGEVKKKGNKSAVRERPAPSTHPFFNSVFDQQKSINQSFF